jgi:hypothetical protein
MQAFLLFGSALISTSSSHRATDLLSETSSCTGARLVRHGATERPVVDAQKMSGDDHFLGQPDLDCSRGNLSHFRDFLIEV